LVFLRRKGRAKPSTKKSPEQGKFNPADIPFSGEKNGYDKKDDYLCKNATGMTTRDTYMNKLRKFASEHGEEYGIRRIGIFGSVAREQHNADSDVDIYYEGPSLGLKSLTGLPLILESYLGVRVDVVRDHKGLDAAFRNRILKDVVYA
jgi:predicted nucleotidyltransferase